ncbi:unnamed protein product [Enterobius vermicularis]|uniref:MIP-T3 domain-containing protein n=1 Tax=Enterobius vermicularis TaxID=51028 RepID=A0A0N4VKE2_ENTVE|nr:unnamed protein product [Enterobius vermicularis]
MNKEETKQLLQPLINSPPLTDQLLQRPPFRFLLDIVIEVSKETNFLKDVFTAEELDISTMINKETKAAFLKKLISVLNTDGSLDDVKAGKILAGKEAEKTNLLLQKLAKEAAKFARKYDSEHQENWKENVKEKKTKTKEKKRSSGSSRSSKERLKHEEPEEGPSREKEERKKRKEHRSRERASSKENLQIANKDESKSSGKNGKKSHGRNEEKREHAKGNKVKGEENREHSGKVSHLVGVGVLPILFLADSALTISLKLFHFEVCRNKACRPIVPLPTRPQTSMGRPGTAVARLAPPKVKKKQVAEIEVKPEKVTLSYSKILLFNVLFNVEILNLNSEEHGSLVKKILSTKKELEAGLQDDTFASTSLFDDNQRNQHKTQASFVVTSIFIISMSDISCRNLFL